MIDVKSLEIRDVSAFIPVIAIRIHGAAQTEQETRLFQRAGFGRCVHCVLLAKLEGSEIRYDPFDWRGAYARTMPIAHNYIIEHWDKIKSTDVIDVRHILGETYAPATGEVQDDE